MFSLMIHAHAADLDASFAFYEKLGFGVHADDVDGEGTRCLRLTHPQSQGLLLNLKRAPYLLRPAPARDLPSPLWPVLFAIVVDDYVDWIDRLKTAGIAIEYKESQPWGIWLHLRDPAGNLLCITSSDLY